MIGRLPPLAPKGLPACPAWAADLFSGAVKVTVSRLRAKLGDPPLSQTIAKAGYRIWASPLA